MSIIGKEFKAKDLPGWLDDLHQRLAQCDEAYEAANDVESQREAVMAAMGCVLKALSETAPFADNKGLHALRDLAAALMQIDEGRTWDLVKSPPNQGRKGVPESTITVQRKAEAVVAVYVLKMAGYANDEAMQTVGREMGRAGHDSRKRRETQAISVDTIKKWNADYQSGDPTLKRFISHVDRKINEFKSDPAYPPSKEGARQYVQRIMKHPLVREPKKYRD